MDYKLLEKLISTHSVTSDTSLIKNKIKKILDSIGVEYFEDGFGSIVTGNIGAEIMFTAHIDEVGFQIAKINDNGTLCVLPVGDVHPNKLDHSTIYIHTEKNQIPGAIFNTAELRQRDIQLFSDLFVDIGTNSKKETEKIGVKPGQTGSYIKKFWRQNGTIFSSSLDDKISVFALLELIKNNKDILNEIFVAFHTDEEMQNHSAKSLTFQFKPEFAIVLDVVPVHQKRMDNDIFDNTGEGSILFYRGGNHIIHENLRKKLDQIDSIKKGFVSNVTMQSLEPQEYENNGRTKSVHLAIPTRGYHGGIYSVKESDLKHYIDSINKVINVLLS